jgi:hypothetical protein
MMDDFALNQIAILKVKKKYIRQTGGLVINELPQGTSPCGNPLFPPLKREERGDLKGFSAIVYRPQSYP